jgi:hypothetical protein
LLIFLMRLRASIKVVELSGERHGPFEHVRSARSNSRAVDGPRTGRRRCRGGKRDYWGAIFSAIDHRAIMLATASGAVKIMMKALVLTLRGDPRAQEQGAAFGENDRPRG